MLRQLAVSIATLIALSHSSLARAEAWFEVEVYIFERQSQSTEQWPMAPIETKTNRAIDLISPVVGQAVVSMSNESAPCTLVYDADANSHCAESTSTDTNTTPEMSNGGALTISGPSTTSSNAVTSYRYPSVIPSEIGSGSQAYASQGSGPVLLASSQGQFASIISSLSRERGNRSLLHMTWQQPMMGKSGSVPIRLFAGKDYSASYHFDGRQIVQQAMASSMQGANGTTGMMTETSAPLLPSPVWQLDGTLNIYLSHYLYIETALNLRKEGRKLMPVAADEASMNATNTAAAPAKVMTPYLMSIPLEQNRRVKSDEIHYLDHPEMGMVIQIRKMAQPNA
ncbi:peptidoglycan binding protein CsiV [Shewanella mangrovisoli]|uniref:peptidoglycan binding protein CsiV n=1 Tax=Shewanella mangrovisoli TaxID=2864211 RepID=UPI001C655542|nr:peptidoglycan binding protein CsiV [Shewanella mangrovisoli]QYK07460.1 peptidoglycan binding protein CsiV [Shewanella mangrovisoli]